MGLDLTTFKSCQIWLPMKIQNLEFGTWDLGLGFWDLGLRFWDLSFQTSGTYPPLPRPININHRHNQ